MPDSGIRSPSHRFAAIRNNDFVLNKGWTAANLLQVGDGILTEAGHWQAVEGIRDSGIWTTVYNVCVADWHTYFVGNDEWEWSLWAHNTDCSQNAKKLQEQLARVQKIITVALTGPGGSAIPGGWQRGLMISGRYYTYLLFDRVTGQLLKIGKSFNFPGRVYSEYLRKAADQNRSVEAVLLELSTDGQIKSLEKLLRKIMSNGSAYQMPWDLGKDRVKLLKDFLKYLEELRKQVKS